MSGVFIALAFRLRAHWLSLDLPGLVVQVVPDDAFYYFEIARRLWAGEGITFDGVAPATGLHYAWLALILPFFRGTAPGDSLPVVHVLMLSTIFIGMTASLLFSLAHRLSGNAVVAGLAAVALSIQPWVLRQSMNGLETSLSLMTLLAAVAALFWFWERPSTKRTFVVIASFAVAFFARSDVLVILAPACLPLLLNPRTRGHAANLAMGVGGVVLAMTASNWVRTGALLQSSATAVPLLLKANWQVMYPEAGRLAVAQQSGRYFLEGIEGVMDSLGLVAMVAFTISLPLLVVGVMRAARQRSAGTVPSPLILTLLGLVVGMVLLLFIHGYVRWLPRPWYFVAASPVLLLLVAGVVHVARSGSLQARRYATAFALVALTASLCGDLLGQRAEDSSKPSYPWQMEMYLAGIALDNALPVGATVGAFNSGIFGYSTHHTVVNLDGIVNEDAARALREGRLLDYMQGRKIQFIVDYPAMWNAPTFRLATLPWWGDRALPPRELRVFDVPGVGWPSPTEAVVLAELPKN